jgi:hypothetical protein
VVAGPWGHQPNAQEPPHEATPWTYESIQDLRRAVAQRDIATTVGLLLDHDPLDVAHVAGTGPA